MRHLLIVFLLTLAGCGGMTHPDGTPVETSVSVGIGPNLTPTIGFTMKDYAARDLCAPAPVRELTRDLCLPVPPEARALTYRDPCLTVTPDTTRSLTYPSFIDVRTIPVVYPSTTARSYGTTYDGFVNVKATRAITDERALARAVQASRDTVRQTAKYDYYDWVTRASRENHNGKVAQDYTEKRSMWSWVQGNIFGHHRKPQPLPLGTCAQPLAETIPIVDSTTVFQPPQQLPDVGTTPPNNDLPPSGVMKSTQTDLEKRVANLEDSVKVIRDWIQKHP